MVDWIDKLALSELHSLYVHAIDRGDLDLLRSLYAPDAIEHHGDFIGGVDAFVEWLRPVLPAFSIATHTSGNLLCAINGDSAESEARGVAYIRMQDQDGAHYIVVNRHFDRYRKIDDEWRFAKRVTIVDWAAQIEPGNAQALVAPFTKGTTDADDLLYSSVPALVEAVRKRIV